MRSFPLAFFLLQAVACGSSGKTSDVLPEATGEVAPLDMQYTELREDVAEASDLQATDEMSADPAGDILDTPGALDETTPWSCLSGQGGTSTLPGVHIELDSDMECVFRVSRALAGVSIAYQVVVDQDVQNVKPVPQDDGHCGKPAWPDGLILFEELSGQGQKYCKCDIGLCPPPDQKPVTIKKGVYPFTFEWHGRNWQGPSDTGNPEGEPFPPGTYILTISAKGEAKVLGMPTFQPFEVVRTVPIKIEPDPLPELTETVPESPAGDFYVPAPDSE